MIIDLPRNQWSWGPPKPPKWKRIWQKLTTPSDFEQRIAEGIRRLFAPPFNQACWLGG